MLDLIESDKMLQINLFKTSIRNKVTMNQCYQYSQKRMTFAYHCSINNY